jgi:hypothetical protein
MDQEAEIKDWLDSMDVLGPEGLARSVEQSPTSVLVTILAKNAHLKESIGSEGGIDAMMCDAKLSDQIASCTGSKKSEVERIQTLGRVAVAQDRMALAAALELDLRLPIRPKDDQ